MLPRARAFKAYAARLNRALFFCLSVVVLHFFRPAAPAVEPGLPAITVPEGFMVSDAVTPGLIAYPMFAAFDHDGRLYIAESSGKDIRGAAMAENPECRVRLLEDTNGDGVFDSSTVFADKIGIPMGVLHHRGSVYVASPPDFLKLTDTNNDGVADQREVLLTGWNVRGTASLHGPFLGPDGWMYLTDGRHGYDIETREGTNVKGLASRIWKCRPDGTGLDWHAGGGFDNPVEVIFTDSGEMIGTMTYFTNPMHGQRDALMHFIRGGVYSKDHPSVSEFKRTGDLLGPLTRFARVAPAGLHRYRGGQFGDEYRKNLFSAHFNPHRVMRHVLTRTNGTFVSEDSDFLVSKHPDFHPTDIVEDADGSLIVVDTGGWYVDQCPLSRISKPQFRGGLYRVSKIGAIPMEDPRGVGVRINSAAAAVKSLQDPRPVVRDRAREWLTGGAGRGAVGALAGLRSSSPSVGVRCDAVWNLHRIGTRPARAAIVAALEDPHPEVRVAAARSIGLTGGDAPFDRLHAMLKDDDAGVRRQVATTLGQLGNVRSNGPLIKAANTATNRFEEHAVIYSLIENFSRMTNSSIKHSAKQFERLPPGSARAALMAFDQMDGSELAQEHVLPLLDYPDEKVQATASWILARHEDWTDAATNYLTAKFFEWKIEDHQRDGMKEIMRAFAGNKDVQNLMAKVFGSEKVESDRKQLIMEVIRETDVAKFPGEWLNPIRLGLNSTNEMVREMAFDIIESRNISGFDEYLGQMAESDARDDLRYRAYGVLARQNALTDTQIDDLIEAAKSEDSRMRMGATSALGRARLSAKKLVEIAEVILPKADAVTFSPLLNAFRGQTNAAVGKTLIATLTNNRELWQITNPRAVERLIVGYPETVRHQGKLLVHKLVGAHEERIKQLGKLAPLLREGNVTSGRRVFFSTKSQCGACHAVGNEGGDLGPDLTAIGKIRSGLDILEAIVFPNASFVPGYEPSKIVTKDDVHSGNIARETQDALTLRINALTEMKFKRSDIKSIQPGEVSIMPAGLDQALTRQELADLLAYLQSLNGEKWLQPDRLGNARKPTLSPAERATKAN